MEGCGEQILRGCTVDGGYVWIDRHLRLPAAHFSSADIILPIIKLAHCGLPQRSVVEFGSLYRSEGVGPT